MNADETIQSAGEDILTAIGDINAEYRPKTGDPIPCFAHVAKETDLIPGDIEFQTRQSITTVDALLHQLGQVPRGGDEFTVDDVIYRVQSPADSDGYFVTSIVIEVIDDGL